MQTINGILTEIYQDVDIKGDLDVEGDFTFVGDNTVAWEKELIFYENEVVTY